MTLQEIAKAADVSVSTVSRVINASPGIAAATRQAVRREMEKMAYIPSRRRAARPHAVCGQRVAFFVLQPCTSLTPAYDHLLRGVSTACSKFQLDLQVGFVEQPDSAIDQLVRGRYDGVLLHGICPPPEHTSPLHAVPTVWLMGNVRRPTWGDQVMPDNVQIGKIAAEYLLGRGHRQMLYFGLDSGWSLSTRALAFESEVLHAGAAVAVHNAPVRHSSTIDNVLAGLEPLIEGYRRANPRPTGLFIAEDWMLRQIYRVLTEAGIRPGHELDVISCNNDRPHLLGLSPTPATIDIRFERIAYRGVERLVSRMRGDDLDDRLRVMIEPALVLPPAAREIRHADRAEPAAR